MRRPPSRPVSRLADAAAARAPPDRRRGARAARRRRPCWTMHAADVDAADEAVAAQREAVARRTATEPPRRPPKATGAVEVAAAQQHGEHLRPTRSCEKPVACVTLDRRRACARRGRGRCAAPAPAPASAAAAAPGRQRRGSSGAAGSRATRWLRKKAHERAVGAAPTQVGGQHRGRWPLVGDGAPAALDGSRARDASRVAARRAQVVVAGEDQRRHVGQRLGRLGDRRLRPAARSGRSRWRCSVAASNGASSRRGSRRAACGPPAGAARAASPPATARRRPRSVVAMNSASLSPPGSSRTALEARADAASTSGARSPLSARGAPRGREGEPRRNGSKSPSTSRLEAGRSRVSATRGSGRGRRSGRRAAAPRGRSSRRARPRSPRAIAREGAGAAAGAQLREDARHARSTSCAGTGRRRSGGTTESRIRRLTCCG